jgi:hypothetical protein
MLSLQVYLNLQLLSNAPLAIVRPSCYESLANRLASAESTQTATSGTLALRGSVMLAMALSLLASAAINT